VSCKQGERVGNEGSYEQGEREGDGGTGEQHEWLGGEQEQE
jgi:hypothetical protein